MILPIIRPNIWTVNCCQVSGRKKNKEKEQYRHCTPCCMAAFKITHWKYSYCSWINRKSGSHFLTAQHYFRMSELVCPFSLSNFIFNLKSQTKIAETTKEQEVGFDGRDFKTTSQSSDSKTSSEEAHLDNSCLKGFNSWAIRSLQQAYQLHVMLWKYFDSNTSSFTLFWNLRPCFEAVKNRCFLMKN